MTSRGSNCERQAEKRTHQDKGNLGTEKHWRWRKATVDQRYNDLILACLTEIPQRNSELPDWSVLRLGKEIMCLSASASVC